MKTTVTKNSKINEVNFNDLGFGKIFTDHMLVANYQDGNWQEVEIKPFENITLSPAANCLHYGQEIFEGLKAHYHNTGKISIFRPNENWHRFNHSAQRLAMPTVPRSIFIDGMIELIKIDQQWVPKKPGSSLYIRPFMFSTDSVLRVSASTRFTFIIILSPSGDYFSNPQPLNIIANPEYSRAVKGGVGSCKNAGNYAATLYPNQLIQQKGFQQILWLNPIDNNTIQEVGMMNIFFYIDGELVTPSKKEETILDGVTRKSVLTLAQSLQITCAERDITIEEVFNCYEQGKLREIFGTGTAAVVLNVGSLSFSNKTIHLNPEKYELAPQLKNLLLDIQYGRKEDNYNWLQFIN